MQNDFDIVIVGAGMVGAALANLLAALPVRIALLDWAEAPAFEPSAAPGLRVSAISCGSQRILAAAGAWDTIAAHRLSPYEAMHVWDAQTPAPDAMQPDAHPGIRFDSAPLGHYPLGYIVENALIQHTLTRAADRHERITLFAPVEIEDIEWAGDAATIDLKDGRALRAGLVVGADGAGSRTRELACIAVKRWDYGQRGVVANVQSDLPHQATAWQRFLPQGPLALLPLADGNCSIVWSCEQDEALRLCDLDEDAFAQALTAASDGVLGQLRPVSARVSFPLSAQYAQAYTAPRLALVGDAAHTVHPLAGQGVNLGFSDAAALAQVLSDALASELGGSAQAMPNAGSDQARALKAVLGDHVPLRRYERWRKGENMGMMTLLDGLHRLFTQTNPLFAWMRRSGLHLVGRTEGLKHSLARRAMGISGDVPRIQRGDES